MRRRLSTYAIGALALARFEWTAASLGPINVVNTINGTPLLVYPCYRWGRRSIKVRFPV